MLCIHPRHLVFPILHSCEHQLAQQSICSVAGPHRALLHIWAKRYACPIRECDCLRACREHHGAPSASSATRHQSTIAGAAPCVGSPTPHCSGARERTAQSRIARIVRAPRPTALPRCAVCAIASRERLFFRSRERKRTTRPHRQQVRLQLLTSQNGWFARPAPLKKGRQRRSTEKSEEKAE